MLLGEMLKVKMVLVTVNSLNEARLHVDSLISEGFHCGTLAALTSVGSHYNSVNFEVVGRWHALGRFESEVLAIESAATQGTNALASKMLGTSTRCQHQSSRE